MRERELLERIIYERERTDFVPMELAQAIEAARAELARPVPSVEDARLDLSLCLRQLQRDSSESTRELVKTCIASLVKAEVTDAVERHRAALAELLDKIDGYRRGCFAAEDDLDAAVKDASALLSEAQKGS